MAEAVPATEKAYWEDTYRFTAEAELVEAPRAPVLPPGKAAAAVVVRSTIFHPQGGGQPSDVGAIRLSSPPAAAAASASASEGGGATDRVFFRVTTVRVDHKTGVIEHQGEFVADVGATKEEEDGVDDAGASAAATAAASAASPPPSGWVAGAKVVLEVDETVRRANARCHSAGHLVDLAVRGAGFDAWVPGTGYHFPGQPSPYVEYKGELPPPGAERDAAARRIEEALATLQGAGGGVVARLVPYADLPEVIGTVPPYLPEGQEARVVTMQVDDLVTKKPALGCPCGGTHVKNLSDLGRIVIKKVATRKGAIRVSYDVDAPAE